MVDGPRSGPGTRSEPLTLDPTRPLVEFSIPASAGYVRVARLAAGDMAERAGFSVVEIDDVRLAVDELCAILIAGGGDGVNLRMQARDGMLMIDGRSLGARVTAMPPDFSEMLLRALVDSCTFTARDGDMAFELRKQARDIA